MDTAALTTGGDTARPGTGSGHSVAGSGAGEKPESTSANLDAMFDEVLAEEIDKDEAAKAPPKTEREARQRRQERTATEAATSAAKNTAAGLSAAIDGLGELFGGKGRLGSGPTFDEQTYAKAKPLFQQAAANLKDAGSDIRDVMRAVVRMVLDKFGAQAAQNMKPYVVRFIQEVQNASQVNEGERDAGSVHAAEVPETDPRQAGDDAPAGHRDRQPVDAGLAEDRQGPDRLGRVPGGTHEPGGARARHPDSGRSEAPGTPRDRRVVRPESNAPDTERDHVIDEGEIGKGGLAKKYRDNVAAIELLKTLESEGRSASADERKTLARYVGWGAMKGPFDPENKSWAKQHAELKALLTDAEFSAARRSTLDAHFTSPVAVGAMYDALARLGFNGGRVLEPSVGVGNFFGLMPRSMRNASDLYGVELDSLTSRMVAALYPNAKIAKHTGFEDYDVPGEFFDAVVGNPPFGSQPLVDAQRSPYSGFSIHNYFLAKGIDKLRPGGIMQVVVSHNFLDAQDARARQWIAERADLIGAVRLPNTAFLENAGTSVVTDILIFRKRDPGAAPADIAPWRDSVEQANVNPKTGETITHKVSQLFVARPDLVLGTPGAGGSMYSANEYTVEPSGDLKTALAGWVESLPSGIYQPIQRTQDAQTTDMAVPDGVKVGSFYLDESGRVMQRGPDTFGNRTAQPWAPPNERAAARMRAMIGLRDLLRAQMRMERSPDATEAEIEANRTALNTAYDAFNKNFGFLNDPTNRRIFFDDTESQLVQALEFDYERAIGQATADKEGIEPRAAKAKKADIFKRRVAFPPQDFLDVTSAKDALLASLNFRARVDLPYMQQVYGKSAEAIIEELGDLVFDDPQAGIVMSDQYLSGDVKTKLDEARVAAQEDPKYQRNVAALQKVIPQDKLPSEITVGLGAAFVPSEVYERFAQHISDGAKATIAYVKATGQWVMSVTTPPGAGAQTGKFGTEDLSPLDLLHLSMLGRGAVVTRTVRNPDGTSFVVVDENKTELAREKQNALKAEWQSWLWSDPERTEQITRIFNEKLNRIVNRRYDGRHLTFPGMNPGIQMLEHQKNGVWRGLQSRQVLFDHVVGAGKTFEMAALAMEMRRLGIARKPLFVVPNHLTLQWRSEFTRLYPGSNVLAAAPEDFAKGNRERMFSRIVTGDWDAVVVGHSSLKKIGLPEITERAVLEEQVTEVAAAIEEMKRARGDRNIIRDMEGIKARLKAKMKTRLASIGERDKVVTFDELGIDAMFIDEMHEFKNLAYNTTMDHNAGMGNPTGSAKAFDLFVKVRWLTDTFGEKAPLVTATGTPISNSLVEMFNMQRYMQYPSMKAQGLHVFDAWARQFGSVENVYEVALSGTGYRQSTRFSKFANLPGLMGLYNTFADTITLENLKAQEQAHGQRFPVPNVAGGRPEIVVAKRSPLVSEFMGVPRAQVDESGAVVFALDASGPITIEVAEGGKFVLKTGEGVRGVFETEQDARLFVVEQAMTPRVSVDPESILGRFGRLRELTRTTKGKVNALSLTGLANKAGLDYRLIDPSAPDFAGSKINLAIEKMMQIYRRWADDRGTQLVFCDMSIPLSARSGFSTKERRVYVRDDAGAVVMKRGTLHALEGVEELPFLIVSRGEKDLRRFDAYDAASGVRVISDARTKADVRQQAEAALANEAHRQQWIEARERAGEIEQSAIDEYNNEHDVETDVPDLFYSRADIAGMSAAAQFSVYDDIKAKLIRAGVPAGEIAFIHDYQTPAAKDKLFKAVNAGEIRFLLGSTPKMGAGTNVQERLVGLHHIDAPWRPSDLEQREGRIIRRGNKLYERDPDGFEVFIGRYATEQTYDTRRWQILEHKARGIEQLRSFDGSINEIEDIDGEAANAADMKAAASGDPLILEETRLRNEVRRLEKLRDAHADQALSLRRRAKSAHDDATKYGPRRVAELEKAVATLAAHPPSAPDAVEMSVDGTAYSNREAAAEAAAKAAAAVRAGVASQAKIVYRGMQFTLTSQHKGALSLDSEIGSVADWRAQDTFSPSGFVQRVVNYANRLGARLGDERAALQRSAKLAQELNEQAGAPFAHGGELEQARIDHKRVQRALMAKGPAVPEEQKAAVAQGMQRQREALERAGFGEALREFFASSDEQLLDISTAPGAGFSTVPTEVRVNALNTLRRLERKFEAGALSAEEYRLGVQEVIAKIEQRNEAQIERRIQAGRRRGADWIVAQLRRGLADGTVPRNEVEFAQWLLAQNPHLAADLGISIRAADGEGAAGDYSALSRVMTLFTGSSLGNGTAVHEILHHTERMMPADVRAGILSAWKRERTEVRKRAAPQARRALDDMLLASLGDKEAFQRMRAAFRAGTLNYAEHYPLYSPSEYWAVNGTRILAGRYGATGSWIERARTWLREFVQRVRGMLDLPSDAPILKALDAVIRGDGRFVAKTMLSKEGKAADIADDAFVSEVLAELAQHDELFRYPVSSKTSLDGVMAEVFPRAQYLGEDTRPDERAESGAGARHVFRTPEGKMLYVFERGKDVWIDVSRLEEGERGSGFYAAVMNYAHNAGGRLIGDPAGLSEAAVVRRTSAMLSSALRFGTTKHLDAAPEQLAGVPEKGIAPLRWHGDDLAKVTALIETFLSTLYTQFPGLKSYRYDFRRQQFTDRSGRPAGPDQTLDAGRKGVSRAGRAGQATLRRGILLQSLVESPRGQRPELLEAVFTRGHSLVRDGGLEQLFDIGDVERAPPKTEKEARARRAAQAFVAAPDGSLDYGEITPEMGLAMRRQAGKIRLTKQGEQHIMERHGRELLASGHASVAAYVANVAGAFDAIAKPAGSTAIVLAKRLPGLDRLLFVNLAPSQNGEFYVVQTGYESTRDAFEKRIRSGALKLLWEASARPAGSSGGNPSLAVSPQNLRGAVTNASSQGSGASVPAQGSVGADHPLYPTPRATWNVSQPMPPSPGSACMNP